MNALLLVMAGGALGAGLRFFVGKAAESSLGGGFPYGNLPIATLFVNVAGGLLMGVLAGYLARFGAGVNWGGENWRLLLGVGVLGGFTTFSAFSLEVAMMIQRGDMGVAAVYALVSVAASVGALFAGLTLVRAITVSA
jgi:fluoride exporter